MRPRAILLAIGPNLQRGVPREELYLLLRAQVLGPTSTIASSNILGNSTLVAGFVGEPKSRSERGTGLRLRMRRKCSGFLGKSVSDGSDKFPTSLQRLFH